MPNYFITMEQLDRWSSQGKIDLAGDTMTVLSDGRRYQLVPAVRFIEELGNSNDFRGLVGRVVPVAELSSLGGEHYMDSVVIGETAYKVTEVYIARLVETGPPQPDFTGRYGTDKDTDTDDAEIVARVLLGE